MNIKSNSGQSLIELVVGIAISVIFLTGALGVIMVTLKLDFQNKYGQAAGELAQEITEQVTSVANADWHNLDVLTPGAGNKYHALSQSGFFIISPDETQTVLNDQTYTSYFTIESVERDITSGQIVASGGVIDPATLKITSKVTWTDNGDQNETVFTRYLTRNRDRGAVQTDWTGGLAADPETIVNPFNNQFAVSTGIDFTGGVIKLSGLSESPPVGPYTNIDPAPAKHSAWNDVFGWLNFYSSGNLHISSTEITGWANSGVGDIVFNCNSTPPGYTNLCSGPSQFKVNNDGAGNLSGYAWNENIGWISFCGDGVNDSSWDSVNLRWVCPASPIYQVKIDQSGPTIGDFHGFAWNDVVGWISMNCLETPSGCILPAIQYKVTVNTGARTEGTLTSLIYNTQRDQGSAPNAIIWSGNQPTGTIVKFQIATDCISAAIPPSCTGVDDWKFMGPSESTATYYTGDVGTSIKIPHNYSGYSSTHYNKKYLRYKVFLNSDLDRIVTPTVNSITINYSL